METRKRSMSLRYVIRIWGVIIMLVGGVTATGLAQQTVVGQEGATVGGVSRPSIVSNGLTIRLSEFATVSNTFGVRHNDLTNAPGDSRLFIVNEGNRIENALGNGQIYAVNRFTGASSLYFNVGQAIFDQTGRFLDGHSGETGLRSVAFHPNFATNGKFYTSHSEQVSGAGALTGGNYLGASTPNGPGGQVPGRLVRTTGNSLDGVLAEWTVTSTNLNGTINATYREVFRTAYQPDINGNASHPIQQIKFNPFTQPGNAEYGLLYVNHGDNGTQNGGTGQISADPYGKIFRINPLDPDDAGSATYSIPTDNPFLSDTNVRDEVYALGFRNNAKITFVQDENGNSRTLVFDIGEANAEEINIIEVGGNYGWRVREGTFVNNRPFGVNQGDGNVSLLPTNDANSGFTYAAAFYGHPGGGGRAIARGDIFTQGDPTLIGQILFSDLPTGRVMSAALDNLLGAVTQGAPSVLTNATIGEIGILFDNDNDASTLSQSVASFSALTGGRGDGNVFRDQDGVLYILNKRNGIVYRVESSLANHVGYQTGEIDGGLDTRGTVIGAFGIGQGGVVDGVTFSGDVQGTLVGGGNIAIANASATETFESYDDGFTGDLADVLQGAIFPDRGLFDIDLTGLEQDHRYLIQFLINDGRTNVDRLFQIAAFGDNVGEQGLTSNLDDALIAVEFISTGDTQSFTFGPAGTIINAYVISDLGVIPEPTTVMIFASLISFLATRRGRV